MKLFHRLHPVPLKFYFVLIYISLCTRKVASHKNYGASIQLSSSSFDYITSHGTWFIKFYHPNCGHCIAFAPTWRKLADEFQNYESEYNFKFGEVDCLEDWGGKKREDFPGERTFKHLEEYIHEIAPKYHLDNSTAETVQNDNTIVETNNDHHGPVDIMGNEQSGSNIPLPIGAANPGNNNKNKMDLNYLGNSNFSSIINSGGWFIYYSKESELSNPFFDISNIAKHFSIHNEIQNLKFGVVNCHLEKELCQKHNVSADGGLQFIMNGQYKKRMDHSPSYFSMTEFVEEEIAELIQHDSLNTYRFPDSMLPNPDGKMMKLPARTLEILGRHGSWFAAFTTKFCQMCKRLVAEWIDLAARLKNQVNVVLIDCDKDQATCEDLGITSYPILKFYKDGVMHDYGGIRNPENLYQFAMLASSPHIYKANKAQYNKMIKEKNNFFVFQYPQSKGIDSMAQFKSVFEGLTLDRNVYLISDMELEGHADVSGNVKPMYISGEIHTRYEKPIEEHDKLKRWLKKQANQDVIQLDDINFQLLVNEHKYVVLGVFDPKNNHSSLIELQDAANQFYRINRQSHHKSQIMFAWIDGTVWNEYLTRVYHKSSPSQLPFSLILKPSKNEYFDVDKQGNVLGFHYSVLEPTLDQVMNHKMKGIITQKPKVIKKKKPSRWYYWRPVFCIPIFSGVIYASWQWYHMNRKPRFHLD